MGCDQAVGQRERGPRREAAISRVTDMILNVMSLLLVGVGLALTATFFVGSPFTNPAPAVERAAAEGSQPGVPAIIPGNRGGSARGGADDRSPEERKARRAAANIPEDKT